tara:strand:- start:1039 stop:2271 length:1233 start_codon:yes stop_codon:yes gene_type:complete
MKNKLFTIFVLFLLVMSMCFAQESLNVVAHDEEFGVIDENNDVEGEIIENNNVISNTQTQEKVKLIYFGSAGCQFCAKMQLFLDDLQEKHPDLVIERYELNQNIKLFLEYAEKYNFEVGDTVGIPIVFTSDKVFSGYNTGIANEIEECVDVCIVGDVSKENVTRIIGPGDKINPDEPNNQLKSLTVSAVVLAAAVDAINPCAFAVLIILLSAILVSGKRKRALYAGLAFTLSIFISYFLMGLGLFSAIKASGLTRSFFIVVAVLAIIIGLFNLKDYLWYGKWFIMEVPLSWRPHMKAVLRGVTSVPGAFMIGFVVSLFLLPCTSGPYIVILGLLAQAATRSYALWLLVLYNLIFILPMLVITFAIYFGITTTEKAEEWRTGKLKILHLIAGVIILLLGVGMFVAMWLGYI